MVNLSVSEVCLLKSMGFWPKLYSKVDSSDF